MNNITSNLPNNGYDLCECGYLISNGICSNPSCPTVQIYDNGYLCKPKTQEYPIIEI